MKNTEQTSYTGKEVFIGIDVHKKSYSVVARCDKEVVKKWTTAAYHKSYHNSFRNTLGERSFIQFTKQDFRDLRCIESW